MCKRKKFFLALVFPILYCLSTFNFVEIFNYLNKPSFLWFLIFLFIIVLIFATFPEDRIKRLLKFFGASEEDFKNDFLNRWETLCYGSVYLATGFLIILVCLYWRETLPETWFPRQLLNLKGFSHRLIWCLGWSLIGFSVVAYSNTRRKIKFEENGKEVIRDVKSPFPSYLYFYPLFLTVNSFLIFGILNLKQVDGVKFFYPVSAFLCANLGFWIDTVNFKRLVDALLSKFPKVSD